MPLKMEFCLQGPAEYHKKIEFEDRATNQRL
jgi:hypothetical protein